MGASAATARLAEREPIPEDDELWEELASGAAAPPSADASTAALCAALVRHNGTSGNFQSLLRRLLPQLAAAADARLSEPQLQHACGAVHLLRSCLKHMIETVEPEDVVPHLSSGGDSLAAPLVEALLRVVAEAPLTDASYWLHRECLSALLVAMSTQLFCELSAGAPQPLLVAALSGSSPSPRRVVRRLLRHLIAPPPPPKRSDGLLRAVAEYAQLVIFLPWQLVTSLFRRAEQQPLGLAEHSLLLLLLLTQNLPRAAVGDEMESNPYLEALHELVDEAQGPAADPEQGESHALSFRELYDAIASRLPDESTLLLLYLLLHGNHDFLEFCLSRADAETLLLPLLPLLYDARSVRPNHLYMLLIVLLIFSQDSGFVSAAQSMMIASVPWYKEHILQQISLGGLLVILLARTVQHNAAHSQDAYVHTNCLAALANMAPAYKKLHPQAARSLVSLYDVLSRKYAKLCRYHEARLPLRAGATDEADELQLYDDLLRIALEMINVVLSTNLVHNEHLIYALLERQHIFGALREHEKVRDLLQNVDCVIEHFGDGIGRLADSEEQADSGDVWSVARVLEHIGALLRDWDPRRLQQFDIKFVYEQEATPEDFFTPYIWLLVYELSGIEWQEARFSLFTIDSIGGDAAEHVPLPLLTSVSVDDIHADSREDTDHSGF